MILFSESAEIQTPVQKRIFVCVLHTVHLIQRPIMTSTISSVPDQRAFFYLVGIGVMHSIAPPMHNCIARGLGYDWKFVAQECQTVEDALQLFRLPTFAGGVVTMPYKTTIMEHLDGLDEYCMKIGACNNVYKTADGKLRGTNTDWRGIKGCLLDSTSQGKAKPALIIGAGGASRAAVYALYDQLQCNPIYIVNRDEDEVKALLGDTGSYGSDLSIVHLTSVEQAHEVPKAPFYIVGTVPDFEPRTRAELVSRDILEYFLKSGPKGVLLDMCFKPRRTRILKLGERYGWNTVDGTMIIAHQIDEQYKLWCGEEKARQIPKQEAWAVLRKAADESPSINF
jgi:quinate dehydrogenase